MAQLRNLWCKLSASYVHTKNACSILTSHRRITSVSPCMNDYVTVRYVSMNYAQKRRPPKKEPKDPVETTSLAAEMFGDFSSEHKLLESMEDTKDLDAELDDMQRLAFDAKSPKNFVKQGQIKNYLEVPERYADADETEPVASYETFLRDMQGMQKGTTSHTMDRFGDVVELVGTANPKIPMSSTPCHGCGANLHCQDPGVPGYIPSETFLVVPNEKLITCLCQRCVMLKKHKLALNVTVTPQQYVDIIKQIKDKPGLVVIVVDLSDLPNSVYADLPNLIGHKRDVYVVGNKVDVLPKDSQGYLSKTMKCLKFYMKKMGFTDAFNVRHTTLVSAKTGYGVEDLVTMLLTDWGRSGGVYVVGCTNVGKSTLYNALLSSDYCRSASRDFISRATTSVWPGTTLNVLKFPIINPKPSKLVKRVRRLRKDKVWQLEEEKVRRSKLQTKGDYKYATLIGHIGQTFVSPKKAALEQEEHVGHDVSSYTFNTDGDKLETTIDVKRFELREKIRNVQLKYDAIARENCHWCYDTPGVINPAQIMNVLTQEELLLLISERLIIPRTYKVRRKQTLFVSGLGRIDYVQGPHYALFTVFCNHTLPVVIVADWDVNAFYKNNIGTERLKLPIGDYDRLDKLPALVGKEFSIVGHSTEESAADITLSSIGWVSVAPLKDDHITVRAYTPGGEGIHLRQPALLPHAVALRGKQGRYGTFSIKMPLAPESIPTPRPPKVSSTFPKPYPDRKKSST